MRRQVGGEGGGGARGGAGDESPEYSPCGSPAGARGPGPGARGDAASGCGWTCTRKRFYQLRRQCVAGALLAGFGLALVHSILEDNRALVAATFAFAYSGPRAGPAAAVAGDAALRPEEEEEGEGGAGPALPPGKGRPPPAPLAPYCGYVKDAAGLAAAARGPVARCLAGADLADAAGALAARPPAYLGEGAGHYEVRTCLPSVLVVGAGAGAAADVDALAAALAAHPGLVPGAGAAAEAVGALLGGREAWRPEALLPAARALAADAHAHAAAEWRASSALAGDRPMVVALRANGGWAGPARVPQGVA